MAKIKIQTEADAAAQVIALQNRVIQKKQTDNALLVDLLVTHIAPLFRDGESFYLGDRPVSLQTLNQTNTLTLYYEPDSSHMAGLKKLAVIKGISVQDGTLYRAHNGRNYVRINFDFNEPDVLEALLGYVYKSGASKALETAEEKMKTLVGQLKELSPDVKVGFGHQQILRDFTDRAEAIVPAIDRVTQL